ncbi:MAG TPA: sulfite oxidase-like oxidoreductase [Elusimicrobiota bacterium]|nr:sulfite oxidase-like oxidoreductase [Elusimicrobiota bacterium]
MPDAPKYNEKMIAAKMKQLERFKKEKRERSASQERLRLPPGQNWTDGFPVLDLGVHPEFDPKTWELRIFGEVENPVTLSWADFRALPRADQTTDFHCVTTWSKKDVRWRGVKMSEIFKLVRPKATANFVIQGSRDAYATNTSVFEAGQDDAMIADTLDGEPLPIEHGGPVRMVIPTLYAWKSAKFLRSLEFTARDQPGYWERRGYHNNADPWKEERNGEPPADDGFAEAAE